jgi:hypothetical protein
MSAIRKGLVGARHRSHSANVRVQSASICKNTSRCIPEIGKIDLALKSGADAPANLPYPGKVDTPKGAMRPTRQLNGQCRYASRSRFEQLECVVMFAIKQAPSASPTTEQSVRLHELARAERRPHWVLRDTWEDITPNSLAGCFATSKRRKPIDRKPPLEYEKPAAVPEAVAA